MGYYRAGFRVVGVDRLPQPNYPFQFVQMDAIKFALLYGRRFDAIHASPPCQIHSTLGNIFLNDGSYWQRHQDMIPQTREILKRLRKPYIIENVPGARRALENPVMLCGIQFGLKQARHRYFESNVLLLVPGHKPHPENIPAAGHGVSLNGYISIAGNGGAKNLPDGETYLSYAQKVMGTPWMNRKEISQAIPPVYTEYLGKQLIRAVNVRRQVN